MLQLRTYFFTTSNAKILTIDSRIIISISDKVNKRFIQIIVKLYANFLFLNNLNLISEKLRFCLLLSYYVSQLLWRHIVLLTVGAYSSNHRVLYTIGISMTRRFQKSVGPFVMLTKKPTPPLLTVEK